MERNANYALVGLISTILLIAMIVFVFWLANIAFAQQYDNYVLPGVAPQSRGYAGAGGARWGGWI